MPRQRQAAAGDAGTRPLWFTPPGGEQNRRPALTRDRVVAEALAVISAGACRPNRRLEDPDRLRTRARQICPICAAGKPAARWGEMWLPPRNQTSVA
jgi:hypothetical protein